MCPPSCLLFTHTKRLYWKWQPDVSHLTISFQIQSQALVSGKLFGTILLLKSADFSELKFFYRNKCISCLYTVSSLSVLCLGTLEFLQKALCFENMSGQKDVAAAQDVLKAKQASSLTCTVHLYLFIFCSYKHKTLLLEICTSVRVAIMCHQVWSAGGGLLSSWLSKN